MRTSSCPYSTASPASARLEPIIPSTGDTTSCWIDTADLVAGSNTHPDGQIAARVVDAHCRGHGDHFALLGFLGLAAATVVGPTMANDPGMGRALGRDSLARFGGRGGPAQSRLPAALVNLDLAQSARRQLGDQGRQKIVGQAGNGVVVLLDSERLLRIGRPGIWGLLARRHRLNLLAAGRALSQCSGEQTTKSTGDANPRRRSSRLIGNRVWAIGAVALETCFD
jgi:hypothetical protein